MGSRLTLVASVAVLVALAGCTAKPQASAPDNASPASALKPIVSVKELMENIIDPQADYIFDAVAVDVGEHGTVETKPTSDDDWTKVQRGAIVLAEATNLLKMPRAMAPVGDQNNSGGASAPELSPAQILAKVEKDRALWNSHAD